ncbi:MAG: cupin domain-containing protein [Methylobacteriaceae bacterium]|nr:cupin domain-containing protein [Rhodoblastus sp.]MCC0005058.1 cupin domain-containing protein [Methylobacteriaceae bacterium]
MTASGIDGMSADEVVRLLDLSPHPEGGFYRETFRDSNAPGGRAASTAIYFLLPGDAPSRWHRVDAAEVWHHYAGAPLELTIEENGARGVQRLGADLAAGERPQGIVPAGAWQSARALGAWTLVGCTVAPGFEFARFEVIDGEPPTD